MLQLFKNPNVDFMGWRRRWISASLVLVACSILVLSVRGLRYGIEFTGGTEVQVKYVERPRLQDVRDALTAAGLTSHVVTTIGRPEENEVYIRIALVSQEKEEDLTPRIVSALRPEDVRSKLAAGLANLNIADAPTLNRLIETNPDIARDDAAALAQAIVEARRERAIFRSPADLGAVPGMTPAISAWMSSRTFAGPFAVRSQSYVGPVIGKELIRKAFLAILGSLAGILVYIWIRFEFQWGLAGVVALVHDTLIVLGLFSLFRLEMSLPVIAAFLTLIGYSINDTVVVFDRIRENIRARGPGDLAGTINESINQTLSRTVITSLLTWLVVLALFFLGGEALRPFSFVLATGIVIGTYSSIYVASPLLVEWQAWFPGRKERGSGGAPASKGGARKVRTSRSS